MSGGIILFGGLAKPLHRLHFILPDALAFGVAIAQIELSRGVILFGGLAIPLHRMRIILLHAPAIIVAEAQIELSLGISLLGFGFIFQKSAGNCAAFRCGGSGRTQAGTQASDVIEDGA